jgi:hypothetical protein
MFHLRDANELEHLIGAIRDPQYERRTWLRGIT